MWEESLHQYVESIDFGALSAVKAYLDAEAGRPSARNRHWPNQVTSPVMLHRFFSSTGTPTYELHGTECVHGSAGQTRPGDVVIAIFQLRRDRRPGATVTCPNVEYHIIALTKFLAGKRGQRDLCSVEQEGDSMNSTLLSWQRSWSSSASLSCFKTEAPNPERYVSGIRCQRVHSRGQ